MEASKSFGLVRRARSVRELEHSLESGEAGMALVVPPLPSELRRGRPAPLLLVADGSDPNMANLAGATRPASRRARRLPRCCRASRPGAQRPQRQHPHLVQPVAALGGHALARGHLLQPDVVRALPRAQLAQGQGRGNLARAPRHAGDRSRLWLGNVLAHGGVALWGTLVQIGLTVFAVGVAFRGDGLLLLGGLGCSRSST